MGVVLVIIFWIAVVILMVATAVVYAFRRKAGTGKVPPGGKDSYKLEDEKSSK